MVRVKAIKYERFSGGICDSCQATGKTPQSDTKDTHEPSYGLTSPIYGRPSNAPEPREYAP